MPVTTDGQGQALEAPELPTHPRKRRMASLLIFLASCLVYLNTLHNGLVYDDIQIIRGNPVMEDPWDVTGIFGGIYRLGSTSVGINYRPLTVWSLALNYRFNQVMGRPGDDPALYHLVNLLLHAVTACLFYRLLLLLNIPSWPSCAASLLFAVHPLLTEAVAGVVGRAEIFAALFGLWFVIFHLQKRHPLACALALLFSVWGKESGLTFLGLAFAADVLFFPWDRKRSLRSYGAYAALLAVWLWVRSLALEGHPVFWAFVDNPMPGDFLSPERLFTCARIHLHYLRMYLVPVGLSSDYSYNQVPVIWDPANPYVLGAAALLSAAGVTAWKARKFHRVIPFAVLGYMILFSVTSNILFRIGSTAERFLYSPSLMMCLLLAYGAWLLRRRWGRAVDVAGVAVLAAFGFLTGARNETWRTEMSFYQEQVRSAPGSAKAYYNRGTQYAKEGHDREAVADYEKALEIFPLYSEPYYNLGNALSRLNADPEKIIEAYRGAIHGDPGHINARNNLALLLIKLGRRAEAAPLVDELERIDPGNPNLPSLRMGLRGQGQKKQ